MCATGLPRPEQIAQRHAESSSRLSQDADHGSQANDPRTDILRDRISAVLLPLQYCGEPCDHCVENSLQQADALIAALNLTEDAGVIVGCAHG